MQPIVDGEEFAPAANAIAGAVADREPVRMRLGPGEHVSFAPVGHEAGYALLAHRPPGFAVVRTARPSRDATDVAPVALVSLPRTAP